ncbi:P-loop containing nucleoside triphosphate hydrolase protein [Lasiosphaeria hispida]|uniref:P-loop containing nucleoside triphosphate hydrolase protein n=1 Tax=Lasiosphaeria hispida TaxID=260671 RepID=A0AAJ0HVH2_9PEZI|nr:P-loop containing nucleoside triphosphate hydrolase protein [Lasiosphaeria hispida]
MASTASRTRDVIFVIGAPGAGKGTLCKILAEVNDFEHLSIGDLLRQTVSSPIADKAMAGYIQRGELLPTDMILSTLKPHLREPSCCDAGRTLLLDGFPRQLDQAREFEAVFGTPNLVLFFDCPEDKARERVITRPSGRVGDTVEVFNKRHREFRELNPPILTYYGNPNGKTIVIDTSRSTGESYQALRTALNSSREWLALTSKPQRLAIDGDGE